MEITVEKILICLGVALVTTILVRFLLQSKRDQWFKRSQPRSLLTARGALGSYLSLGYPVTWQGFAVTLALVLGILGECWVILRLF